jgi:hypothetical protein
MGMGTDIWLNLKFKNIKFKKDFKTSNEADHASWEYSHHAFYLFVNRSVLCD